MHRDTSPDADRRYVELLRGLSPHQRLEAAMSLSRAVRALAEAGIRARHPEADETTVRHELVALLYGREVATRVCPLR